MSKKFIHLCAMCGKDFEDNKRTSYKCPECEAKLALLKKVEMLDKAEKKLLNKPLNYLIKRPIDLSKEVQAIKKRVLDGKDRFSSIQEAMVAIQLERKGIVYESQKKINGRKVDFFLPELKVVLEIDGSLYHTDEDKEFLRDRQIMQSLDNDFQMVHIEADSVPRLTWNLGDALNYILGERKACKIYRDCSWDENLLEEFRSMEIYLAQKEWQKKYVNKAISRANQTIG